MLHNLRRPLGLGPFQSGAAAGFTLIEVMITVAIVAILAAVALPSYSDYVRRGKDQAAFGQLNNYRVQLEQYYQDNRSYGNATACGLTFPVTVDTFTYNCTPSGAGQAYYLEAVGESETYRLDQAGVKTTQRFKGAALTANCWLVRSATCP